MAQTIISVKVDESLKKEFEMICSDIGMSADTAMTVFIKAMVREKGFPFAVTASSSSTPWMDGAGKDSATQVREAAAKNEIKYMTMEEIFKQMAEEQKANASAPPPISFADSSRRMA